MAYASLVATIPNIRAPHVTLPKWRWPTVSPRARALFMMGLMISPAFLCDSIGYWVQRLSWTPEQIAQRQVHAETTPWRLNIFPVACGEVTTPDDQARWAAFAERNGWRMYPQGGVGCFRPDRVLVGFAGLKTFNVACPTAVLSVADRQRWMDYAARHDWAAYPQAGPDCVDP